MKLIECGKGFLEKDGQIIGLVLTNLITTYDVFCNNWQSHKEDGKDYSIDVFCDLLIRDQQKFLVEGNIGGKQQAHFRNGKGKKIYEDRGCVDDSFPR